MSFARTSISSFRTRTLLIALVLSATTLGACRKKSNNAPADDKGSATSSSPTTPPTPGVPVAKAALAEQIVVGDSIYFKTADGTVKGWGNNSLIDEASRESGKPATIADLANTKRLALGGGQTMCAVMNDGTAKCWGNGASGELGDGKDSKSDKPVAIPGISNAAAIGVGSYFVCALIGDGTVKCWGNNSYNKASVEKKEKFVTPTTMPDVTSIQQIAVGGDSTCALAKDGTVKCWGLSCGAAGPNLCVKPFTVAEFAGASSIAGGWKSMCAVVKGAVHCYGGNDYGMRGTGSTDDPGEKITQVKGLTNVKELAAGQLHWCALLEDGTVQCWGSNEYGQLGDPGLPTGDDAGAQRATPAPVTGLSNASSLSCGSGTCCVLLADKSVKCWGENPIGAWLGAPNAEVEKTATPVVVPVN
jgi:alpha-tubulin suppressor-like RCC1 family protein